MGSEIAEVILFGALAIFILRYAWKKGFFALLEQRGQWITPLKWYQVVFAFSAYFGVALFVAPFLAAFLHQWIFTGEKGTDFLAFSTWLNFLTSLAIFSLLALFAARLPHSILSSIWRREKKSAAGGDVRLAFFCWLLSFPLVLFTSQFLDLLVHFLFHVEELPEQIAVHFLKTTFGFPFYFFLAVATVVFFAPLIEETLFRGFLQSFIRQHLGSKQAILITSLCFSLFHYSPEQGLGNIPIIGSLFILALFLGFAYEKRASLLSPLALHASFNAFSILNLYFLGGFPKSPL